MACGPVSGRVQAVVGGCCGVGRGQVWRLSFENRNYHLFFLFLKFTRDVLFGRSLSDRVHRPEMLFLLLSRGV